MRVAIVGPTVLSDMALVHSWPNLTYMLSIPYPKPFKPPHKHSVLYTVDGHCRRSGTIERVSRVTSAKNKQ